MIFMAKIQQIQGNFFRSTEKNQYNKYGYT